MLLYTDKVVVPASLLPMPLQDVKRNVFVSITLSIFKIRFPNSEVAFKQP